MFLGMALLGGFIALMGVCLLVYLGAATYEPEYGPVDPDLDELP